MKDRNGKDFKVGDIVWIPMTVGSEPRDGTGRIAVVSKHGLEVEDGRPEHETFYVHPEVVEVTPSAS